MPSKGGFQLTKDDIEILRILYGFRMAEIDHLSALTGRSYKKLHGRLLKLYQHHYVSRVTLPLQKHLYLIGAAAVPLLVEQGIAPKETLDVRLRQHELKELFLKHMLMVTHIHTCLAVASRGNHVSLVAWEQGRELWDSVEVLEGGDYCRLPVRPDAFFTLEDAGRPDGRNRARFFLEADRSTTTHQRFQKKVKAYWQYFNEGGHTKKHGIKTFRVLTVTLTPERALNLCQLAEEVLPKDARRHYLFGSIDKLPLDSPTAILASVFLTPSNFRQNVRNPLVAPFTGAP